MEKTDATQAMALNVRLKATDNTSTPVIANYTRVGVAQGVAYVDFGFIEPVLLGVVAQRAKNGDSLPKHMDASVTTRVALPIDALARLQQQLSQIVSGVNGKAAVNS
jgi:hypothetical protein